MNPFIILSFIASAFLYVPSVSSMSTQEGDSPVLARTTMHYPATTINPEPTYPYTHSVVHDPLKIKSYKEQFGDLLPMESAFEIPEDSNVIIGSGRQDITYFGMGEYRFGNDGKAFLYTDALRDCIAVIAFDPDTGKSCLYHASKMEIRVNDFNERGIEQYVIPAFKDHFKDRMPQVTLVASAFTQDLLDLRKLLEKHGIIIHRVNIPDIVQEYEETKGESGEYIAASDTVFVDKDTVPSPILQNVVSTIAMPSTSVMLDEKNGTIGIFRK